MGVPAGDACVLWLQALPRMSICRCQRYLAPSVGTSSSGLELLIIRSLAQDQANPKEPAASSDNLVCPTEPSTVREGLCTGWSSRPERARCQPGIRPWL